MENFSVGLNEQRTGCAEDVIKIEANREDIVHCCTVKSVNSYLIAKHVVIDFFLLHMLILASLVKFQIWSTIMSLLATSTCLSCSSYASFDIVL